MSYDQTQYPYDTVVQITGTIGGEGFTASGVLIAGDEVLTASHVVYQAGVGTASNLVVTPGAAGSYAPFGRANGTSFHYNMIDDRNDLISLQQSQNDFAVIHLDHSFGIGTMSLYGGYPAVGTGQVTGYPGSAGGYQVTQVEYLEQDPQYSLYDGVAIGPGSSGGPFWVLYNNTPTVVGIVSSGDSSGDGYFTEITPSAYSTIESWLATDHAVGHTPIGGGGGGTTVSSMPLIDPSFYDTAYPDVAAAHVDPVVHYENSGWHEGRNPDAFFSTVGYLAANQDVKAANVDPAVHYDQSGWKEGRDPGANFNTRLYLLHNPDVAAAGVDPLAHYLEFGEKEGRQIDPAIGPASSIVGGFDPEYYLLANPDVARAGVAPLQHYETHGWREGRNPNPFFDTRYYLSHNADVARAMVDPLLHYDTSGWKEGRDPSAAFHTGAYLAHSPDVAAAHVDPLEHYLQFGIYEGRAIS